METIQNRIQEMTDQLLVLIPDLTLALLAIVVFHFLGRGIRVTYRRMLEKRKLSSAHVTFFGKFIYGLVLLAGILLALNIIGLYGLAGSILASGGITAIALGFAFRDIGENLLAGFFLAFSRPFNPGDLIESEGLLGRVKTIELRYTHIRTEEGCDVYIPSGQIFKMPLKNYTRDGLQRAAFTIGIDYGDDAQKACKVLEKRIKSIDVVLTDPAASVQIQGFTPTYVELSVYFWINAMNPEISLPAKRTKVMQQCRLALLEQEFTFSSGVTTALEMDHLDINVRQADTA
ncbi:MAG: mechanosensitive ion channel [Balneolaceae bacterium]|nr:mechanosensitive ion channel [Balneolaceae bacterium]